MAWPRCRWAAGPGRASPSTTSATGVEGAGGSGGHGRASRRRITTQHRRRRRCGGRRRVRRAQEGPGCGARGRRRGPAGLRANTPNHASAPQAPPVWRAPEGPEGARGPGRGAGGRRRGLAGQRADAPSHASATRRRRCGGRRRVRRARAGFEIDHSEPLGSRVAISRAAGPDGARNTIGAASTAGDQARLQAPLEIRTPRSTPGSGRPGGHRGGQAH